MSLSDLASLGSFVSGFAVAITLLFLLLQVRQAAKHTRSAIAQNWTTRMVDIQLRQAEPPLSDIVQRGRDGDDTMTAPELFRFMSYVRAQFWTAEDNFIQHRNRMLSDAYFKSVRRTYVGIMRGAGMQAAWDMFRDFFDPGFTAFMDDVAKEAETQGFVSVPERWTELVAQHKAKLSEAVVERSDSKNP
jgi:hypothetical protein